MADRTTNSLDVAMNKLSDQRLQVHTRFGVADLASRRQLFLGSPRRDRHVLVADQPAGLDRRDGVTYSLTPGLITKVTSARSPLSVIRFTWPTGTPAISTDAPVLSPATE